MIHKSQRSLIFCVGLFYVVKHVDDGTLVTSVATVVSISLLDYAADSKSGRRDNASATTLSRSGLYSTEKSYSSKKNSYLAILYERSHWMIH